jgi:hypothetical protein
MNFPSDTAGEKDEQFEFIAADVFLRRFIIDLHSANPVFIALGADVFFWIAGEIGCSCSLDRAVFRLFGDYFEVGFALGLGLQVIPTCRANEINNLHFDVRHLNTLPWTTSGDLAHNLPKRISAVVGVGPNLQAAPDGM